MKLFCHVTGRERRVSGDHRYLSHNILVIVIIQLIAYVMQGIDYLFHHCFGVRFEGTRDDYETNEFEILFNVSSGHISGLKTKTKCGAKNLSKPVGEKAFLSFFAPKPRLAHLFETFQYRHRHNSRAHSRTKYINI